MAGANTRKNEATVVIAVVCFMLVDVASCYPWGPPVHNTTVCDDMFPAGHGFPAFSDPPYEIQIPAVCYTNNQEIKVTVNALIWAKQNKKLAIEGIFVQARHPDCGAGRRIQSVGRFKAVDDVLVPRHCHDRTNNAIGHSYVEAANKREFMWTAPPAGRLPIYLVATVVHERDEFWVNVRSDVLWHCDANRGGRVYSSALVITYGMLVFALWSL